MDMEDVLLCAAALLAEDERVAAQVRRQYKLVRRRRVPGRQPDPGGAARPVARRPRRPLRGRRPGADDLLLRRRQLVVPRWTSPPSTPGPPRSSWSATTAPRRRWSTPPTSCSAGTASAGVQLRSQREAGAEVTGSPSTPTRSPRPSRWRPTITRADQAPAPRPGEIAVLFRINAQSEAFEEALAARGVPYVRPRRGPVLRAGRGQAGRDAAARQRPRRRRARATDLVTARARRCSPAWAGRREAPTGRGNVRDRWESLQAIVSQAEELAAAEPDADAGRLRRRARPAGRRAARPGGRGRHAGDAARRQGPGVGRGVRGRHARGHDADHLRRRPGRGRGGAPAALRRDDPGPAAAHRLLVAGPHAGRPLLPQAVALPDRAAAAGGLRPRPPERGPRSRKRKGVAHCRECGKPLGTTAERKVGRCEDCPATYDEELFERLRAWRVERAGAGEGARVRRVHRPRPCRRSPRSSRPTPGPCCGSTASAQAKLTKYGDDVLALVGAAVDSDDGQPTLGGA